MNPIYGAVAEFETADELLEGIRAMRMRGFRKLEAYTPFPIHGLNEALGIERSRLGYVVLGMGLLGAAAALLMQWWMGAVDYPLVIAGKPFFALEPSIPVTFELAVLFGAFGAVLGMFAFNGLPRLYHPVFRYSRFARATDDRFLLAVEGCHDPGAATAALKAAGGEHVEVLEA